MNDFIFNSCLSSILNTVRKTKDLDETARNSILNELERYIEYCNLDIHRFNLLSSNKYKKIFQDIQAMYLLRQNKEALHLICMSFIVGGEN